jgi:hypothetical protein
LPENSEIEVFEKEEIEEGKAEEGIAREKENGKIEQL